jgi:hypothetical protein
MRETGSSNSWGILLSALLLSPAPAAQEPPRGQVDFAREIRPIFEHSCAKCHGPEKQKGGFRLDLREAGLKGGNAGKAIVPGNAAGSRLVQLLLDPDPDSRMPRNDDPLPRQKIDLIRRWIDEGAAWPDDASLPDPRRARHWAWIPPVRPEPPAARDARTPIDAFLAAERERRGLAPRPPAPRATLLRRVTLDLTGLPPTRAELRAFLEDSSPEAYEKVVDRLLASPAYGERWGRHWMDVWRYSDWYGRRKENDVWNSWPTLWRWRDWIVRALNEDKGYDRMVLEMLAGDELAPGDDDTAVATGFIVRNWFSTNYSQWRRDLVEHTGKAFLGLTLNCALCHDHKYDPISQEDYFRFQAFFEPVELRQDRVPGEPDPGPFLRRLPKGAGVRKPVKGGLIRVFDETLDAKTRIYLGGDDRKLAEGKPPVEPGPPAFLGAGLEIAAVEIPPAAAYPGLRPFFRQEDLAARRRALAAAKEALEKSPGDSLAEAGLASAEAEMRSLEARIAADDVRHGGKAGDAERLAREASRAQRAAELAAANEKLLKDRRSLVQAREKAQAAQGDAKAKAEGALVQAEKACAETEKSVEAAAKALEAPGGDYAPIGPVYPRKSTGRRTALARWIAGPENPLAARVAANHIWMRHFGKPLVESVFEFGRAGKEPSHPALLDWLAVELRESGWRMKAFHRTILLSGAYRMDSADGGAREAALDPDNRWLWRFPTRRLEAEAVRDSVLHVSGRLDPAMGGPELEGRELVDARRRSLYFSLYPEDGGRHPFLEVFDPPDPCDAYRRSESILPQQALAMANSRLVVEESRVAARRLREESGGSRSALVEAAFEGVLSRRPSAAEAARCEEFLGAQEKLAREDPALRAAESLVRVLFNHHEFVTIR